MHLRGIAFVCVVLCLLAYVKADQDEVADSSAQRSRCPEFGDFNADHARCLPLFDEFDIPPKWNFCLLRGATLLQQKPGNCTHFCTSHSVVGVRYVTEISEERGRNPFWTGFLGTFGFLLALTLCCCAWITCAGRTPPNAYSQPAL